MHNGYQGGGAGTLIFSYTKAWPILAFWEIQNFEFQHLLIYLFYNYFLVGGRGHKIESLWRIQILWIHFGGHHKTGLFLVFILAFTGLL